MIFEYKNTSAKMAPGNHINWDHSKLRAPSKASSYCLFRQKINPPRIERMERIACLKSSKLWRVLAFD